jgi:MoxR-like ATPase
MLDLKMETISQSPSEASGKPRTISERLAEVAKTSFIGRQKELTLLSNAIEADNPPFFVAYVHGPGGIGKSRLVQATISNTNPKVNRYIMDCREIDPTSDSKTAVLMNLKESRENGLCLQLNAR